MQKINMKKILIVDDNEEIRDFMRAMFETGSVGVYEAGNGKEALDLFTEVPVDLVITDSTMPVMSGFDFMKCARDRKPETPFIVVSATQRKERYEDFNLRGFFEKPFLPEELESAVQDVLREEAPVPDLPMVVPRPISSDTRPVVRGRFLFHGDQKIYVRGVTYGPFRPDEAGCEYHTPELVQRDFSRMAAVGLNTVRVYTIPPRWLLDIAARNGLYVMIGLPWEQHITFLDDKKHTRDIAHRLRANLSECTGHPAILCYAVGNEIPSGIVRWHGSKRVAGFLDQLVGVVKTADPGCLVTYVNYPSTEYLELKSVDLYCFNVYLESRQNLEAYIARLQNLAGERPLLLAEIGLDSMRNGQPLQAETLAWQIRTIFDGGAAGCFVFAWTDEWHRGGFDIED